MPENANEPPVPGIAILPPITLSDRQAELCDRLDALNAKHGLEAKSSDMFRGALFAMQVSCRSNPDWVAQAANSLRETLYPFYSAEVKKVSGDKKQVLETYGSARTDAGTIARMNRLYSKIQGLAHHGNVEKNQKVVDYATFTAADFNDLLTEFEEVMLDVLSRQVDIHNQIDEILTGGVPATITS